MNKQKNFWLSLIILLVVVVALSFVWKFVKWPTGMSNMATSTMSAEDIQKETATLVSQVSKLMLVPDETPTVATIMDVDKLAADQAFYTGAINGDKLLVFTKSQRAIIYSPSRNLIVNSGPVYFNNQPATSEVQEVATSTTAGAPVGGKKK